MAQRNTAVTETPAAGEKKLVKIKVNSTLRGSYGAFDRAKQWKLKNRLRMPL